MLSKLWTMRLKARVSISWYSEEKKSWAYMVALDINIIEGRERLDYDYLEPLGRLIVQAKNSKILAK